MELRFEPSITTFHNKEFNTDPLVIHGNGPTKRILNSLGNYIPRAWDKDNQCTSCWDNNLVFEDLPEVPQVREISLINEKNLTIDECFRLSWPCS